MKKSQAVVQLFFILTSFFVWGENRPHEIWWEESLGRDCDWNTFAGWLGGIDAPSRVAMRNHVNTMEYTTILDVPSGLCVDYVGITKEIPSLEYRGLDVTPVLVERADSMGIPVTLGSIEQIPFGDNTFDLAYSRHILEHLDYYELAVNELIRVANKEVMVIFFIEPTTTGSDRIASSIHNGHLLYHNCYNKTKLETFILKHPKVSTISWETVPNTPETILHVYLAR